MKLTKPEIKQILNMQDEYGLRVSSIGSPIGKVKLLDVDDGTHNAFIPFAKYLKQDVGRVCELALEFDAKLIRGFSFYHPKDTDPGEHLPQVVEQLGQIAEACDRHELTFGLEVEANLIGQNGQLLAALARKVKRNNMVLIFDGGNLAHQGYSPLEVLEEFQAMRPYLGWMHVKDYRATRKKRPGEHVDEEADWNFVPADVGDSAHEYVFRDLRDHLEKITRRLKKLGLPRLFLHAQSIAFPDDSGNDMHFTAPLADDLERFLNVGLVGATRGKRRRRA